MTHATKAQVTGIFQGIECKATWEKDRGYTAYGNRELIGEILLTDAFPPPVGGTCYWEENTPERARNIFYTIFEEIISYEANGSLRKLPYRKGVVY